MVSKFSFKFCLLILLPSWLLSTKQYRLWVWGSKRDIISLNLILKIKLTYPLSLNISIPCQYMSLPCIWFLELNLDHLPWCLLLFLLIENKKLIFNSDACFFIMVGKMKETFFLSTYKISFWWNMLILNASNFLTFYQA